MTAAHTGSLSPTTEAEKVYADNIRDLFTVFGEQLFVTH